MARDLYELWGKGANSEELHADIRHRTEHRWPDYEKVSFSFGVDTYCAKRTEPEKKEMINRFAYLGFKGPIRLKDPDQHFVIFEDYVSYEETVDRAQGSSTQEQVQDGKSELKSTYFGRWICSSSRDAINKYDLKKRKYIATTSMEAELSLVTANMALAAPGKIFFDPFVGTGSFLVAAAFFGATTLGADIDGRSFKGKHKITKENPMGLLKNFKQYGTENMFIDAFASDITNTPIRSVPFLDGIVCDPPYGIREGLKVLGARDGRNAQAIYLDGKLNHT